MFIKGFTKSASTVVTMTPEEYFEIAREKDPYAGSLAGAAAGAAAGALKGARGRKAEKALIGAALGSVGGAAAGHVVSKAVKKYQSHKVRRMAEELHLRSTPKRADYSNR